MNTFHKINLTEFQNLIEAYRQIQADFLKTFQVNDIFSNSKIYEIMIAHEQKGREYEESNYS